MKNLLKAHCATYRALKAIDHKPQIGIVHQALKFVPYRFFDQGVTLPLTEITHDAAMRFFATGRFDLLGFLL
jgi:beta-glucosidase/6-phospho-beta-glucosidase/beta-galactosidase